MKLYMLWFVLVASTAFVYKRDAGLRYGHHEMCQKLKNDFVEKISQSDFENCLALYNKSLTFSGWEQTTNDWLSLWGWSHLSVYSPQESVEIWESKSQSIGVKIKTIENRLLVYRAHPDSSFEKGDLIVEVNGVEPVYASDVTGESGQFKIVRKGQERELKVKAKSFLWDDKVEIFENTIRVPSFRGEFFKDEELKKIKKEIELIADSTVYIDLRDNIGGNIASALRLMSLFLCEEKVIGTLRVPSREGLGSADYPLTVDQSVQVDHMKKYGSVHLKVPGVSSCTKKEVKVLVNGNTASTAELVAQAFQDLGRGLVIGEQTSGRMVLSSWDQIIYFPKGFYFSHPYALYLSSGGNPVEGRGVTPEVLKAYVLKTEMLGEDSFKK